MARGALMMSDEASRPDWAFNVAQRAGGIERNLAKGVRTPIFPGDNVMISVVRIEPNTVSDVHSHSEEQWGFLIEGECVRVQDGAEFAAKPGDFSMTPANVPHGVRTGAKGATVVDVFSPPREAYRRPGRGFGTE